jgi:dimethylhistidine N-methyltransferase
MSTLPSAAFLAESQFAADVRAGLATSGQKSLPSTYLYDALGSALFEAITLLPEYGLTRADARVIARCAPELPDNVREPWCVAELGSGSGRKTRYVLEQFRGIDYYPIDVSAAALDQCAKELAPVARVRPVEASYIDGLRAVNRRRTARRPLLLLFLGSTIGNFDGDSAVSFLRDVRKCLRRGDALLIGADLVKPARQMLAAYDDPSGVTAAFNKNLLGRINRELGGRFDLRAFRHEARWNAVERAMQMFLVSTRRQRVAIAGIGLKVAFDEGESIWTESSHKYDVGALDRLAADSEFKPVRSWTDAEWPFAECLWHV